MKAAAVQMAPVFLDSQASTDKALEYMCKAAAEGAELIAFQMSADKVGVRLPVKENLCRDITRIIHGRKYLIHAGLTWSQPLSNASTSVAGSGGSVVACKF